MGQTRTITIHLGDLRDAWDIYCESIGKKPTTVGRELISTTLESQQNIEVRNLVAEKGADTGKKIRKEIRLTPSEYSAIEALCRAQDVSFQRWVIHLIRANLTQQPQFSMKETEALWDSCYQLKALGRNINQIAKHLNEGKTHDVGSNKLKEILDQINRHTIEVNNLVAANVQRWVIK